MSGEDVKTDSTNSKNKEMLTINRKRKTLDSSFEDFNSNQMSKKKTLLASGSVEPVSSIHTSVIDGVTIQELLEKVNTVRMKGLISEYAAIRMEAPVGTFETSK